MFRLQLVPRLIPNSMRMLSVFALAAFWLLILSSAAGAFDVIQITDNSSDDQRPAVSGSNVVWDHWDGNDYEIYLWDGVTTTNISDNSTHDWYSDISGSNVVWQGCDGGNDSVCSGGDWEIYMADISKPTPVPSISLGGLALLAGLVLGTAGWLIWRRRFASA